jgi:hypothetical protein
MSTIFTIIGKTGEKMIESLSENIQGAKIEEKTDG